MNYVDEPQLPVTPARWWRVIYAGSCDLYLLESSIFPIHTLKTATVRKIEEHHARESEIILLITKTIRVFIHFLTVARNMLYFYFYFIFLSPCQKFLNEMAGFHLLTAQLWVRIGHTESTVIQNCHIPRCLAMLLLLSNASAHQVNVNQAYNHWNSGSHIATCWIQSVSHKLPLC